MFLSRRSRSLMILLLLVITPSLVMADSNSGAGKFRLSGFATLGMTRSGSEDLGFRRDLYRESLFDGDWSVAPDSLLAVQLDYNFNEKLDGAIQLVGKDRVEDSWENALEWAFLRYRFNPDWTLRAGRIGLDLFMLSEYRNLGFSYLWARPSIEFYTPIAFDSFDGADLTWSRPVGEGTLRAKLFYGETTNTFTLRENRADLTIRPLGGGTLAWETDRWQLRASLASGDLDLVGYFPGAAPLAQALDQVSPLWPVAAEYADKLYVNKPKLTYSELGAAYTGSNWTVQTEIAYVDSDVELYPPFASGYFSVGRKLDTVTIFGMASTIDLQSEREIIPPAPVIPMLPLESMQMAYIQQELQGLYDIINVDQTTLSAGLRWDLRYDLALKMQWDHTMIPAYHANLWDQRATQREDTSVNTFSINLNCIF